MIARRERLSALAFGVKTGVEGLPSMLSRQGVCISPPHTPTAQTASISTSAPLHRMRRYVQEQWKLSGSDSPSLVGKGFIKLCAEVNDIHNMPKQNGGIDVRTVKRTRANISWGRDLMTSWQRLRDSYAAYIQEMHLSLLPPLPPRSRPGLVEM